MAFYRAVSLLPVFITFCIYAYLLYFYVFFFIKPSIQQNFEDSVGIPAYWGTDEEGERAKKNAIIFAAIFGFMGFNLLVAITKSIFVSPGHIPDDKEWDMETDD